MEKVNKVGLGDTLLGTAAHWFLPRKVETRSFHSILCTAVGGGHDKDIPHVGCVYAEFVIVPP